MMFGKKRWWGCVLQVSNRLDILFFVNFTVSLVVPLMREHVKHCFQRTINSKFEWNGILQSEAQILWFLHFFQSASSVLILKKCWCTLKKQFDFLAKCIDLVQKTHFENFACVYFVPGLKHSEKSQNTYFVPCALPHQYFKN